MSKVKRREPFRLPELEGVRETQATKAYHAIRAMILRCELAPGSVINDRDLTKRLRIGRTPIREALLRLSGERLVIFQQNQSIQVSAVDLAQINDLYTLRLHLERLAWRLWLERATQEQIERLATSSILHPRCSGKGDIEGIIDLDFLFHSQVYQECGNSLLTKTALQPVGPHLPAVVHDQQRRREGAGPDRLFARPHHRRGPAARFRAARCRDQQPHRQCLSEDHGLLHQRSREQDR